ncbi:MAG TPA: hypothetical protein VHY20_14120, partial [Pirellulales bacterium]|nr:hypothetical protein [Pirellulales bacterium]
WSAYYLVERLEKVGIPTREVNFSGAKNQQLMATTVVEAFSEGHILLWRHKKLLADLRSLRIELKGNCYKLSARRNSDGHADRAFAMAMAMLAAKGTGGGAPNIRVGDLEDPEVKAFVAELRKEEAELLRDEPQRGWQSETYESESWR